MVTEEGSVVAVADVSGTVYHALYDLSGAAPTVPTNEQDLLAGNVFVALVNDDYWTKDAVGYNFRFAVDESLITAAHVYRAYFRCDTVGGSHLEWAHDYRAISLVSAVKTRVVESDVRSVIETNPAIELMPFIVTAHTLLDSLSNCMNGGNTEEMLFEIEKYMAAHLYAQRDPQYQSKSTGRASATFQGQTALGFESTWWGQTALRLDGTGCLAGSDRKKTKVSAAWLGKPPSTQIPYVQRR